MRKFDQEENERCFFPNNQKIKYHSMVLLEAFPLEEFSRLADGLDNLFSDLPAFEKRRLTYRKILKNPESLSSGSCFYLPYVHNLKFKGKILPTGAFYEFGEDVDHIHISLCHVLPSMVVLRIHVYLSDVVADRMNQILCTFHNTREIPSSDGTHIAIYHPDELKRREILAIRDQLKINLITFFSKYFTGYFFSHQEDVSVIPSIDIYSLDYPDENTDILAWANERFSSLNCFGILPISHRMFRDGKYLLFVEVDDHSESRKFTNCAILANRRGATDAISKDVDVTTMGGLKYHNFDLFALNRLLRLQEGLIGDINSNLSKEFSYLEKNQFDMPINQRKKLLSVAFNFERFNVEFKQISKPFDAGDFISLCDEKINLFDGIYELINKKSDIIREMIHTYNEHSRAILDLKYLEYSKKMQEIMWIIGWASLILALVQLILVVIPSLHLK